MNLPFTISASVSGLILHSEEDTNHSYVEFEAYKADENTFGLIRFTFDRFLGGRLYSMGGEAGAGIGQLSNSSWLKEINTQQKKWYPKFSNNFKDVKHYFFRGHDASIEVLAEGYSWEIVREFKS